MDSLIIVLIVLLVVINLGVIIYLIRYKPDKPINPEQTFKDEFNSFKETFGQSFGSMSKETVSYTHLTLPTISDV